MPHWLKLMILALMLLLLARLPLAWQSEEGSATGKIMDSTHPLAGARVEAWELKTGNITGTTSDAQGEYKLIGLRPGRYFLYVSAEDHRSEWSHDITIERGGTAHEDMTLKRAAKASE